MPFFSMVPGLRNPAETAGALCGCLLFTSVAALAQGPVLIQEVISREVGLFTGADADYKQVVSREVALFVGANPDAKEVVSREVSLCVSDTAAPPPVSSLVLTVSPTRESVTVDWSSYNQWEVRDVDSYAVYFSTIPFTSTAGLTPVFVRGENFSFTFTGLTTTADYYFAVVPVDALGHAVANVTFTSNYALTKEIISREVALFNGHEGAPQYKELVSREVSLLLSDTIPPPPVTNLTFTSSPTGKNITLTWDGYNQWETRDIASYQIFRSTTPFTTVTGLTPYATVPGENFTINFPNLPENQDSFWAIVAVDGQGNRNPLVGYKGVYVISPQVISREVALFNGQEPPIPPPVVEAINVTNNGFENPSVDNYVRWGNMSVSQKTAFAWTVTGNGSEGPAVIQNGSDWGFQNAPEGTQALSLHRDSVITQSFNFPQAGTYTLSWKAASRGGQVNPYEIRLDGVTLTQPFTTSDSTWQPQAVSFDLPAGGTHTLTFAGLSQGNDLSVGLDQVALSRYVAPGVRPLAPYREVVSREVSLVVASPAIPEPVTGLTTGFEVTTATTQYAAIDVNWNSYDEAAQRDVRQYRIYVGNSFFDNVAGMTPFKIVADGKQQNVIYGMGTNGQVISAEQIYFVGVVAEDVSGQFNPVVYSESVKTSVGTLGDVSNVVATPAPSSITYTWDLGGVGTNLQNFVGGFNVYIDGPNLPPHLQSQPIPIGPNLRTWTATSLAFGTTYTMRIATVDILDHESAGVTVVATTLTVPPGDLELTYNPSPDGSVSSTLMQSDQQMIVLGYYTNYAGVSRNSIARVDVFGNVDAGFNPNANGNVYGGVIQPDGKIIVCGDFTTVGGVSHDRIARLLADGSVDAGFNVSANGSVRSVALQSDGAIVLCGDFTQVNGVTRTRMARVSSTGALDNSFNPAVNAVIRPMLIQADGKIIIGGNFTTVGGVTRNRIARLNPNGTLETSFNPDTDNDVYAIHELSDGRLLIGGGFTNIGGTPRNRLARLSSEGVLDASYNPNVDSSVWSVNSQADGRALVGGTFTTVGGIPRNRMARLLDDGTLDPVFNPDVSPGTVYNVMLQPDGKIVIGGNFTSVGGQTRNRIARLYNNPAPASINIGNVSQFTWMRGGTSAEAREVLFDVSTNLGFIWQSLGNSTRIAGGWEKNGTELPPSGILRSRARASSGLYGASSGFSEQRLTYNAYRSPADWRQFYFSTTANAGNAANMADPDGDGVVNLLEFAFGLDPRFGSANAMPAWTWTAAYGFATFTAPAGITGITYGAEWSTSLQANDWQPIPDTGIGAQHSFLMPTTGDPKLFVRFKVTGQ